MGRPGKLNDTVQSEIITALQMGATYEIAAQYSGISYASFRNWMIRGEACRDALAADFTFLTREEVKALGERKEALPERKIHPDERPYLKFFEAVSEAMAVAAVNWLKVIDTAANNDPTWAAWMLKNRYPKDFGGQKQQIEVSTPNPIEISHEHSGQVGIAATVEVDIDRISAILGILADAGAVQPGGAEGAGETDHPASDEVHSDPTDR